MDKQKRRRKRERWESKKEKERKRKSVTVNREKNEKKKGVHTILKSVRLAKIFNSNILRSESTSNCQVLGR